MSDAGKIMLGTDGNPLLSADGKIVLASDSTYPMWVGIGTSVQNYTRTAGGVRPYCSHSEIWGKSWNISVGLGGYWYEDNENNYSGARQGGSIVTIPEVDVPWARVKKIQIRATLTMFENDGGGAFSVPGETLYLTSKLNGSGGIPTGTTVLDDWDVQKTYYETAPTSDTVDITIETGGAEVSNVYLAMFFGTQSCSAPPPSTIYALFSYGFTAYGDWEEAVRLVYNLATA